MKKQYSGSCHCGAVRFTCQIDLAEGTSRCNCSICTKSRFWKAIVVDDAFRLEQGEQALTTYQFGSNIRHQFCKHCGVKTFGRGHLDELGDFHAVNVACLDASPDELARAPVSFEDGLHDRWQDRPEETGYL